MLTKKFTGIDEILAEIDSEESFQDLESKSGNFKKHLSNVELLFGIKIHFSPDENAYFLDLDEDGRTALSNYLVAFDFLSVQIRPMLSSYVLAEPAKKIRTFHVETIIKAMVNRNLLKFSHCKSNSAHPANKLVEPYLFKEFRGNWYLMAIDCKTATLNAYNIDEISRVELAENHFSNASTRAVTELARNCFGITLPTGQPFEEITLSFRPEAALPLLKKCLHPSQQININQPDEIILTIKTYTTPDLIQELLKYGKSVKVLKPASLATTLKLVHKQAYLQYRR